MEEFLTMAWGDFVFSAISVPIICYAFCFCLKQILVSKVAKNRYTNLIPLFSMIIGVIIMLAVKDFLPVLRLTKTRIYMGMVLGLSATGIHQFFKRMKHFFEMRKIEKGMKRKKIEDK